MYPSHHHNTLVITILRDPLSLLIFIPFELIKKQNLAVALAGRFSPTEKEGFTSACSLQLISPWNEGCCASRVLKIPFPSVL